MNKEVEIKISPEDAKGLKFGSEIRAIVIGTIKSIREEKVCDIPVSSDSKEEPKEPEIYICVNIDPTTIKLGGKEIGGGGEFKDVFSKKYDEYKDYLGLKKSMEKKGKAARANGDKITGE